MDLFASRLIYNYSSTPSILHLETRSTGSNNRCLPPDLGNNEMLCKPSMGTDIEGPLGDQSSTSRSGDYSTSLEGSVVVPSSPLFTIRFPSSDNIPTRSNTCSGVSDTSAMPSGNPTGCMAHLREYCQTERLSKQASELLMASWRDKSTKSYKSLFHKWESLCTSQEEI